MSTEEFYNTIIEFLNILRRKNVRDSETARNYRQLATSVKSIVDNLTNKFNNAIIEGDIDINDIRFQAEIETLRYTADYLSEICREFTESQAVKKQIPTNELSTAVKKREQQNNDQRHGKLTANNR